MRDILISQQRDVGSETVPAPPSAAARRSPLILAIYLVFLCSFALPAVRLDLATAVKPRPRTPSNPEAVFYPSEMAARKRAHTLLKEHGTEAKPLVGWRVSLASANLALGWRDLVAYVDLPRPVGLIFVAFTLANGALLLSPLLFWKVRRTPSGLAALATGTGAVASAFLEPGGIAWGPSVGFWLWEGSLIAATGLFVANWSRTEVSDFGLRHRPWIRAGLAVGTVGCALLLALAQFVPARLEYTGQDEMSELRQEIQELRSRLEPAKSPEEEQPAK